jgi:hypothetical protein
VSRVRAVSAHVLVALYMLVAMPVIGARELWRVLCAKVRQP